MIAAVVPVKDLAQAKQRLAPLLSDKERRGFVLAMLADVLSAFADAANIARVFVVAHDPQVGELARARGADTIAEPENLGYDAAVATAVEDLAASDLDALLVVPADVPLLAPRELDALAAPINAPGVRIAPARDGGTNGLLLAPPALLATRFGPDSAARHRLAAAAAGASVEQLNVPGLAFDIDTPQDLRDFCARTSATQSRAFLEKCGILARLLEAGEP